MDQLYEIVTDTELRNPALVLALSGWVDAGTVVVPPEDTVTLRCSSYQLLCS